MALHQSDSLVESLNHVARPVWAHSSLFSHAVQDGEFAPVVGSVLGTHCDPVRYVKVVVGPADETGLPARPIQTLHS